jgi:hypothetical protein
VRFQEFMLKPQHIFRKSASQTKPDPGFSLGGVWVEPPKLLSDHDALLAEHVEKVLMSEDMVLDLHQFVFTESVASVSATHFAERARHSGDIRVRDSEGFVGFDRPRVLLAQIVRVTRPDPRACLRNAYAV